MYNLRAYLMKLNQLPSQAHLECAIDPQILKKKLGRIPNPQRLFHINCLGKIKRKETTKASVTV